MQSIKQAHSNSAVYFGDRPDYLVAYARHRDPDTLTESNWQQFQLALDHLVDDEWAIESSGHWVVGWVEYLIVQPHSEAQRIVEELLERLADYPILDEEHFSQLEDDNLNEFWQMIGLNERIQYLNENEDSIFAARATDSSDLYHRAERTYYQLCKSVNQ